MRLPRFFVDAPLAPSPVPIELPEAVAHHAVRVLRLAEGAPLILFNGQGGEYHATLIEATKRQASVRVEGFDPVERESPLFIALVQAILAADAMDYALRKSVELGVGAIQPVVAARSQYALGRADGEKRLSRWRAIAIAACEQCGRNRVPTVAPPIALDAALPPSRRGATVIAGPGADTSLAAFARQSVPVAIVIGPEGGFTDDEMRRARECGVTEVHLGPRVLRAETAGVAALAMLAAMVGDAR